MTLQEALEIPRGLTALIGGGGKSTLLLRLGQALAAEGHTCILCTTTHMHLPAGTPLCATAEEARALLSRNRLVTCGARGEAGKLCASAPMEALLPLADYVLCEADGSKRLPLKAHLPHEPVVPRETKRLLYLVGLDGIGAPIPQAAHRAEVYGRILGRDLAHRVTPADVVQVILQEGFGHATLVLNKGEGPRQALGRQVARLWPGRALITSLLGPENTWEIWEYGEKCAEP